MGTERSLRLVTPDQQQKPDENLSAIVDYLVWLICDVCPEGSLFLSELLRSNLPDVLEVWYWFDAVQLTHRIVFWGDVPPSSEVMLGKDYKPYIHDAYCWFPLVLYDAFFDELVNLEFPYGRMTERVPLQQPHQAVPFTTTSHGKEYTYFFVDRTDLFFWDNPLSHFDTDFDYTTDKDINQCIVDQIEKRTDPGAAYRGASVSEGQSWKASIRLADRCNRLHAIPIAEVPDLLNISLKTAYNYCKGMLPAKLKEILADISIPPKLECIPCKSGYTYVTKQSIENWVRAIAPDALFDVGRRVTTAVKEKRASSNSEP